MGRVECQSSHLFVHRVDQAQYQDCSQTLVDPSDPPLRSDRSVLISMWRKKKKNQNQSKKDFHMKLSSIYMKVWELLGLYKFV